MTTVTIDLERVLSSGKKNTYEGRAFAEVISCIARSKRVVCLTGAGISTSAGIPDFRSKEGLYKLAGAPEPSLPNDKSNKRPGFSRSPSSSSSDSASSNAPSSSSSSLRGADLFSTQVFSSAASLSKFYKFISNLNSLSASAQPTPTHHFIRTLSKKGKLLRVYTQNIDGLEERVGLTSANPHASASTAGLAAAPSRSSSKGKAKYEGDLVHLHGRAALVRCTVCTYSGEWTDEISQAYEGGYSIQCSQCSERLSVRKALGKRSNVAVGSLRPAITLYGEQGMEDLFISEISNADIKSRPDCLIIFGTSMKVHGFKQLARDFAREVQENDGKVIYVNLGEAGKEWSSSIDYHVQGHTDKFVQAVLEEWRHIRPQDFQSQSKLSASDFTTTKSKVSVTTKGKKGPAPDEKSEKSEKEAQVVRPVSPSRAARKRARYEDDDDYEDTSHARSTPSKAIKQDNGKMPDDSKTAKPTSTGPKLPSFKKIAKLPNVSEKHALPSPSKSESPDLRSDSEEDSSNPIQAKQASSAMATPYTSNSREQQSVAVSPSPRRSSRMQNDSYQVPQSTRWKRDLEDIPLVADMDSDQEEESVYVLSSRVSSSRAEKSRNASKTAMMKSRPVF